MKRTQIRRSAIKPTRRKATPVRDAYLKANPKCEAATFLRTCAVPFAMWPASTEAHHLVGGSGRKDIWSNLLTVCGGAHAWIEANPVAGRIVCAYLKHAKGELDLESYNHLFGQSLVAWLESDKVACLTPAWLENRRKRLVGSLGGVL